MTDAGFGTRGSGLGNEAASVDVADVTKVLPFPIFRVSNHSNRTNMLQSIVGILVITLLVFAVIWITGRVTLGE